jgi:hypothetical protein
MTMASKLARYGVSVRIVEKAAQIEGSCFVEQDS